MEVSHVQKIARVLNILVVIALVCNIVILFFVPVAVLSGKPGLLEGLGEYFGGILHPNEDDIVAAGVAASFLSWLTFWQNAETAALTLFLVAAGICTALILWQGRPGAAHHFAGGPLFPDECSQSAAGCFLFVHHLSGSSGAAAIQHLPLPIAPAPAVL